MTEPSRPALRFHGSKWLLAPWIIEHFPQHECYVEPFGGGAAVLLRKPRSWLEVYNDLDNHVVNYFRVLRERPDDLVRAIELYADWTRVDREARTNSRYGTATESLWISPAAMAARLPLFALEKVSVG